MPHLVDVWKHFELSPLNGRSDNRKVCIYGAGLGKNEAPLTEPEWDVWALNLVPPTYRQNGRMFLRVDRWFDLHQRKAQTPDDMRWIAECPVPIYLPPDLMDASSNAVRFPLEEIEAEFGAYWAVSFAYQTALVMYENVKNPGRWTDIGFYGVELAHGTERERTFEWACLSYWIGRAEQSGLNIVLPNGSLLGRHFYRYGFQYTEELEAVKTFERHNGTSDAENRKRDDWAGDVGGR